jgi:probable HAF family extracellular repeat protein
MQHLGLLTKAKTMPIRKTHGLILAPLLLLALSGAFVAAQEPNHAPPRYTVTDLGTLGGTYSLAGGISNSGWVSGQSTLLDGYQHPAVWSNGVITDLGTLGGLNGWAGWRPNDSGEAGGAAETSTPDPNGEDYCGFGTHLECRPFLWRDGAMTELPTLGGNNGESAGVNNLGQVGGGVENTTIDPTCKPPQGYYQVKAVVWENGKIRELPTLFRGDSRSWVLGINDRGQMVGVSGNCSTNNIHPLLWQDRRVIYLGTLGGKINNGAYDINNQGQVIGYSDLAGDTTMHGFLWQKRTGMIDLGTLPGDVGSDADGINNLGQVVGGSWDADGNDRAYIWQNGVMTDLNTLIPPNSPLYLIEATGTINDWGQIAGIGLTSAGDVHAFLATPTWENWTISERPKVVLPDDVRKLVQQLRARRVGHKLPRAQ